MTQHSGHDTSQGRPRLLNIGCGRTFHRDWINLDASPVSPGIIRHDLRRGIPFSSDELDAVYGSHVLEHMDPSMALAVLRECFRVLKPGGTARIAVPDLEMIVRLYLSCLEGALADDPDAEKRYDWMMLELYDQAVRKSPGGMMASCLREPLNPELGRFVASRIGEEARAIVANPAPQWSTGSRLLRRASLLLTRIRIETARGCARVLLGREGSTALREGIFRRSGEVHQWMYDRFSLRRALIAVGFVDIQKCGAGQSCIPRFAEYGLETMDGEERKPDSLYMEARKPMTA